MSEPLKELARRIPAEYRKEMLELNMIDRATATPGDETIAYLEVIWQSYIEPGYTGDCNLCKGRLLKNLQGLKPFLIALEKEANLLRAL